MMWCTYHGDTGRIENTGTAIPGTTEEAFAHMGLPVILNLESMVHWDTHYIADGQPVERTALEIGVSGMSLIGVPPGATVTIEGQDYEADGSAIELEFDLPGTYTVKVALWPHLPWSTQIENPAHQ